MYPPMYPSMYLSIHPCIHPYIHPSVHPSTYLPTTHQSIHPFIHPFIHPCIHSASQPASHNAPTQASIYLHSHPHSYRKEGTEWWFGKNTKGEEGERLGLGVMVRHGPETRKRMKVRGVFPYFLFVCLFLVVWFGIWWVRGSFGRSFVRSLGWRCARIFCSN